MVELDELVYEFEFVGIKVPPDVLNKCLEVCGAHTLNAEEFVEEWVAFAGTSLDGDFNLTLKNLEMLVRKQLTVNPAIEVFKSATKNDSKSTSSRVEQTKDATNQLNNDSHGSNSSVAVSDSATVKTSNFPMRSNAGLVLTTFDPKQLLQTEFDSTRNKSIKVQLLDCGDIKNMPGDSKYIPEVITDEIEALITKMTRITNLLIDKYSLDVPTTGPDFDLHKVLCGRVRCEGDGHLNASSILLETIAHNEAYRVGVIQPKNLKEFSFFPGQIIAMRTHINPSVTRDILTPQIIHIDATPDLPKELPQIEAPLKIIAACGPFTLMDNLAYEPLQELIKLVVLERPDVLILVGPFVDARHVCVARGEIPDTFRSYFETLISDTISPLHDTQVQIIIIPSAFDVHHLNVYPTPRFDLSETPNVHMMPDPSLFSVNGVVIGATSADVLFHMGKTEMHYPASSPDRIGRFISHLLEQQSFYPLYPPVQKLRIDQVLLEKYAKIPVMPHLMILPSNFGQFVKNVRGCIVVNPERLTKGYDGGTYAQIQIYPNQTHQSLVNNISCKIIKI